MADTTPDLTITTTPQSVSALGGPAAGLAVRIANNGVYDCRYAIALAQPDRLTSGSRPLPSEGYGSIVEFAAGENDIWLWTGINSTTINVELV